MQSSVTVASVAVDSFGRKLQVIAEESCTGSYIAGKPVASRIALRIVEPGLRSCRCCRCKTPRHNYWECSSRLVDEVVPDWLLWLPTYYVVLIHWDSCLCFVSYFDWCCWQFSELVALNGFQIWG